MDLLNYDPSLPELPLLRGLRLEDDKPPPRRFDWAAYVIRLAQVMAEGSAPRREG